MFWMQGELDSLTIQAADYRQHFLSMYQDFTARVPVEKCGIITTRTAPAHTNIRMIFILQALVLHSMVWVPARSCQTFMWYAMCMNSGLPMKGRHSISGIAIRMAFLPIRCAMGLMLFRLVSMMLIMISIFLRSGHNENGIVAADNMYAVVYGASAGQRNFVWRDAEYQAVSQVTLRKNNDMVLVGILDPVYLSKQVSYVTSAGLSYDFRTGTLTAGAAAGDQYVDARMSDGTLLARLTVHVVDHYDYEDSAGRPYTGLYQQQDGQWIYVKNGSWAYDYTGFVAKDGDWWYVENGRITFHCNGLVRGLVNGNDTWWYVIGSKVNFCNTVASNACGWWKITNGRVDFDFSGLAENAYGWWKITNGQVDFSYVGYEQNGSNWWYVYGGQVCFQATDVLPGTVGGQYGWWKVCEGKVNFDDDVCENTYGWWKITTGKVDFQYTGLAQNACGWWMIQNGHVNFGSNGLVDNGNGWWLVRNGGVDFTYNGLVDNGNGWWLIRNGYVDFNYNGLVDNGNGWWLVKNGCVDFSYQGYVQNECGVWWVSNGQVQF